MKFVPVTMMILVFALAGCEKQGPAERAGEKVDETTTDMGNKIEDKCEEMKDQAGAKDPDC